MVQSHKEAYTNPLYFEVGELNRDSVFSGAFNNHEDNPVEIYVRKTGAGRWTLASDDQSADVDYDNQANVTVSSGTLELARIGGQIAAKDMTIESGATLRLANAEQSIGGNFTTDSGAVISIPMDLWMTALDQPLPTAALLTIPGSVNIADDTIFNIEIQPVIEEDFIALVDLDKILSNYRIPEQSLQASLDAYNAGEIQWPLYLHAISDNLYQIDAVPGASLDVPEPSTVALLILGCAAICRFCRNGKYPLISQTIKPRNLP